MPRKHSSESSESFDEEIVFEVGSESQSDQENDSDHKSAKSKSLKKHSHRKSSEKSSDRSPTKVKKSSKKSDRPEPEPEPEPEEENDSGESKAPKNRKAKAPKKASKGSAAQKRLVHKEYTFLEKLVASQEKSIERLRLRLKDLTKLMNSFDNITEEKPKTTKPKTTVSRDHLKKQFADKFFTSERTMFDQKDLSSAIEKEAFKTDFFNYPDHSIFGIADFEMEIDSKADNNNKINKSDIGTIVPRLYEIAPKLSFQVRDQTITIEIEKYAKLALKEFVESLNKASLIAPIKTDKGRAYRIRKPFAEAMESVFPYVTFDQKRVISEAALYNMFKKYSIMKPLYIQILNHDAAQQVGLTLVTHDDKYWVNSSYMNKFFKPMKDKVFVIDEEEYKPLQAKKYLTSEPEESEVEYSSEED